MSLRKQLSDILPSLLPGNPADSIKGTELIRLTRLQLTGNYSDASLRYHFSIMSCDPASPIAKVEKGQGYYRRSAPLPALSGAQELLALTQGKLDDLTTADQDVVDETMLRIRKFRAVVTRYFEINGRFPFAFRQAFGKESPISNLWKYPELVLVDWETGGSPDEEMSLDETMLAFKQRLGIAPFTLNAARLRIQPSLQTYREDFFQTLAVSMWAQGGELIYAAPVQDEALGDSLRRLSAAFGVGVTSFGLTPEALDDLVTVLSIRVVWDDFRFEETSPGIGVPQWWYTVWLPVLCALTTARALQLFARLRRASAASTAPKARP